MILHTLSIELLGNVFLYWIINIWKYEKSLWLAVSFALENVDCFQTKERFTTAKEKREGYFMKICEWHQNSSQFAMWLRLWDWVSLTYRLLDEVKRRRLLFCKKKDRTYLITWKPIYSFSLQRSQSTHRARERSKRKRRRDSEGQWSLKSLIFPLKNRRGYPISSCAGR